VRDPLRGRRFVVYPMAIAFTVADEMRRMDREKAAPGLGDSIGDARRGNFSGTAVLFRLLHALGANDEGYRSARLSVARLR
jgi:hypothetical protein